MKQENTHKINTSIQYYKTIPIQCIDRKSYKYDKAKRYTINGTNQNVWIPNKHLQNDGTLLAGENIDYVFRHSWNQCRTAGIDLRALNRRVEDANWQLI